MSNKITDECISCGACAAECPNDAITQGDTTYVIDANKCNECANHGGDPACKNVCPTDGAIVKR